MSIQTTPFLHLPQWTAEEQPSFLGEINPAWAAIDRGYGDIKASADTAITTANAAVSTANSSQVQSEANAGQITQLQQRLQNLENSIAEASMLQGSEIEATVTDDFKSIFGSVVGTIIYNKYCCFITMQLQCKSNVNMTFPNNKHQVATFSLPFAYYGLNLTSDVSTTYSNIKFDSGNTNSNMRFLIDSNGINMYLSSGFTTIETGPWGHINIRAAFPIFTTDTVARNNLPENCLFIPSEL